MISFSSSGSLEKTIATLTRMKHLPIMTAMQSGGARGVAALSAATPYETGLAGSSWSYEVSSGGGVYTLTWTNSDVENGFPVVIRLQYGYATGTGGYVAGRDFINPAMRPIFEQIANDIWKVVTSA